MNQQFTVPVDILLTGELERKGRRDGTCRESAIYSICLHLLTGELER